MRLYILGFMVILLAYLAYKKYQEPEKYTISILVLTLVLLINGYMEYQWQQTEHQANRVAVMIAGKHAGHLHCQRLSETMLFAGSELGHVVQNSNGTLTGMLTYQVCHDFQSWLHSNKDKTSASIAETLHIIVHESEHLTGVSDESKTECLAMGKDATAFELLGATPEKAKILADDYHNQIYPMMPPAYNSLKC